jgi:DNA-binding transcriptional ArsR family regulator
MSRPKPFLIRSRTQLEALSSSLRQELSDVLAETGAATVAELAAILGRAADGLYYHLRILEKAGLVTSTRRRLSGRKTEVVYRSIARGVAIDIEAIRRDANKTLCAVVGSMLRLGARDYRRALGREETMLAGPRRELMVRRKTAWLKPAQVRAMISSIDQLDHDMSGSPKVGRLYAITILFTPLKTSPRGRKKTTQRKVSK